MKQCANSSQITQEVTMNAFRERERGVSELINGFIVQ